MLSAKGLRKTFGKAVAVDGVDLLVEKGSCFGLLGPNGAGKTTTISIIVGVLEPDVGSISLENEPEGPTSQSFKKRIGYVPQELALYEDLTAWENLRFFALIYGLAGARLNERIGACLKIAGLEDRAKHAVRDFSGGMKRRLNIAIALIHEPEFIILDEPTVGVDPQSRNAIFDVLEELRRQGKTLLYTTHYMEEVERLCDQIAIMDHGKVVATGSLAELQKLVPGKRRVTIEIEGGSAEVARGKVLPIDDVRGAEANGSTLTVDVERLEVALPGVLKELGDNGIRYGSLESNKMTLEEVFLHLTGRSLRD